MFLDFYNLREQPFGVTPDPRYLYLSPTHREALASLYYGIDAGRGFLALIAEPGMGKTTLLFQLLERLRKSACTVFLFQTQCSSCQLLRYILADMGIETRRGMDLVDMHAELNQALVRMSRDGKRFVVVIDEAQNLDDSVLETVRLLSDFETASSKLMQIVLAGQPQLAARLASPALVQLRQRIAILTRLEPFSPEETGRYIDYRLQVAGHDGRLFTPDARAMIATYSAGIPREINNLSFNALSLGYALGRKEISGEIVREAAQDLDLAPLISSRKVPQSEVPAAPAMEVRPSPSLSEQKQAGLSPLPSVAFAASLILASLILSSSLWRLVRTSAGKVHPADASVAAVPGGRAQSTLPPDPSVAVATNETSTLGEATRALDPGETGPLVIEVKPNETLERICLAHFGRSGRRLLRQILWLNPEITDPNYIKPGQRVILPGGREESAETYSPNLTRDPPMTSERNKP
jgi:general secretion pathway protein A